MLCPEILEKDKLGHSDLEKTLRNLSRLNVERVNIRQPYGQPHIENPLGKLPAAFNFNKIHGMDSYFYGHNDMLLTFWDVHYVEVESINLYANGRIITDYPVTRGHSPNGIVQSQENFKESGRVRFQWVTFDKKLYNF